MVFRSGDNLSYPTLQNIWESRYTRTLGVLPLSVCSCALNVTFIERAMLSMSARPPAYLCGGGVHVVISPDVEHVLRADVVQIEVVQPAMAGRDRGRGGREG